MKIFVILASATILSCPSFAQGTILFDTFVSGEVNAPVYAPGQTASGVGIGMVGTVNAQLFLVTRGAHGSPNAVYTALLPATTFMTTTPSAARHVVVPADNVVVPGFAAGETVQVILRAWTGASYEAATDYWGQTPIGGAATVLLGGQPASGPSLAPGNLLGLQGFEMNGANFPEPSTLALGLLGAAALLHRRSK